MILPISVIIPTMNRPESLDRTLRHISESVGVPQQIIVVDQSTDSNTQQRNRALLETYAGIQSKIYIYQKIPSLTKARNLGLSKANNEIIVFSDDDVDVKPDTFTHLMALFDKEDVSMVGGLNELDANQPASVLSCILGMASFNKRSMGHVTNACYGRFPDYCTEKTCTEWAMGFFFAVRKSLLNEWGIRFDEKLKSYAYAEDLDFSYGYYLKSTKNGYGCYMSNKMTVRHNVSREYRIPDRRHVYMAVLHRYYISRKYGFSHFELANLWSNLGLLIYKLLKRENPCDLLAAQMFYFRHRRDILEGNFHYDEW